MATDNITRLYEYTFQVVEYGKPVIRKEESYIKTAHEFRRIYQGLYQSSVKILSRRPIPRF